MKVKMNQILTAVSLVVAIFGASQAQAHCSWEHPGHCVGIGGGPGTGGGVSNKIKDPNFSSVTPVLLQVSNAFHSMNQQI